VAPAEEHKSGHGLRELTTANLASSTYYTCFYYDINISPSYWQLPPPTWKLNEPDDTPLPVLKKWKCQKKKKSQPIKHKYLHAAFC
jgi:hypothetical protein